MNGLRGVIALVASATQVCPVCAGTGQVGWEWVGHGQAHTAACPHCSAGRPAIYLRRWRTETPREAS